MSRFFQSCDTMLTMLRTSSGSLFQSSRGQMAELVDQERSAALGQEQQGEAGRHQVVLLAAALPEPGQLVLMRDQLFGAQAIPVVLAEEPHAGEPPGALESVKVIVLPLLAVADILVDVEMRSPASRCRGAGWG